jgi:Tol biopolymer transport system component
MRTLRIIRNSTVSAATLAALALLFTGASVWAVSPGEKGLIIFTANPTGSSQIYTINPDGSNMVQITKLPPTKQEGLQPTFSPDGRRILFSYGAGSAGPDLYLINSDGTGLTQLTFDGLSSAGRWSPDGSRIVFAQTSTLSGVNVIISMRADGEGKKTALTSIFWDSYAPAYTPDGRHIVYYSQQGGLLEAVWIMDADGSEKKRLTPASLELFPYDVSPDGQHILMWNHNSTSLPTSIFVMNIDGTDIDRLTHSPGHHDLDPSYSPDGTRIVFASDRLSSNASLDLFTMNADGSDIKRIATGLTVGGCPDQNCVTPRWGPKTTN